MSWLAAWPALGTFNSSISFSCFSGELLADASQRLPVRTARPWASPRLAAVTRLPSQCQDNLQPGTGAVGTGTFTALLRLKTPRGPADAALEPSGVSPAFTRLSLLRAVLLFFLCVVLGLQEEENVKKICAASAFEAVGITSGGAHGPRSGFHGALMCKPRTRFFRWLLVLWL